MKRMSKIDKIELAGYTLILTALMVVMVIAAIHHAQPRVVAPVTYPKPSPTCPVVPFTNEDQPLGPELDTPGAASWHGGDEPNAEGKE